MTDTIKIGQLPTLTTPTPSDEFPASQAGITKKITLSKIGEGIGYSAHAGNAAIHREINDSGSAETDLWSASKILSELNGKAASTHEHSAADLTSGILGIPRGGTGVNGLVQGQILYGTDSNELTPVTLADFTLLGGVLSLDPDSSVQRVAVSFDGTGVGTRREINFQGAVSPADDDQANRVDVLVDPSHFMAPPVRTGNRTFSVAAFRVILPGGIIAGKATPTTIDLDVSGLNGLANGSPANNTFYHLYLVAKADGSDPGFVFSTVNEAVGGDIALPSGYDLKKQLPFSVKTDGSANFQPVQVGGGWPYLPFIHYRVDDGDYDTVGQNNVLSGGSATSYADIDLSSLVPPTSRMAELKIAWWSTSGFTRFYLRRKGSSLNGFQFYTGTAVPGVMSRTLDTDTAQAIQYRASSTNGRLSVWVIGYVITEVIF
jgi:hypothetical protein